MCTNGLLRTKYCINALKTKKHDFYAREKINLPFIKFGKHQIKETDSTKCFEVYFDKNIIFDCHIQYIPGRISKSVGVGIY